MLVRVFKPQTQCQLNKGHQAELQILPELEHKRCFKTPAGCSSSIGDWEGRRDAGHRQQCPAAYWGVQHWWWENRAQKPLECAIEINKGGSIIRDPCKDRLGMKIRVKIVAGYQGTPSKISLHRNHRRCRNGKIKLSTFRDRTPEKFNWG